MIAFGAQWLDQQGQEAPTFIARRPVPYGHYRGDAVAGLAIETPGGPGRRRGAQWLLHDTLRVSCRKTAATNTAERLMLHKNTVRYWVRKAEKGLGRARDSLGVIRGPGIGIARLANKAQQASRMVSSWISTAIFAKADAYCLLWCAQNSNSRRPGSRTRT
jgi:hypothetical protein